MVGVVPYLPTLVPWCHCSYGIFPGDFGKMFFLPEFNLRKLKNFEKTAILVMAESVYFLKGQSHEMDQALFYMVHSSRPG